MKKRYSIGTLTTEEYPIVEAALNERIEIEHIFYSNISGGNRTFDLHHVPAGDVTGTDNFALVKGESVSGGKSAHMQVRIYLEPGDRLTTHADAVSGIVLTLYGQTVPVREEPDG